LDGRDEAQETFVRESEFQKGDIPQWLECMIEKDWVVDDEVSALAL